MQKEPKMNFYRGIKLILLYITKFKKETIILSLFGVISAIGNGTVPYIIGQFFDALLDLDKQTNLFSIAIPAYIVLLTLWFLIQLGTYAVDWKINIKSEELSNTIWTNYLAQGFSTLWELPMSFHKKNKIGSVGDKINRAANALETIAGRVVIDLSPQLLSILIALTISYLIQPILALVLLLGVTVYVVIMYRSVKPLAGIQKVFHERINSIWGDMYDAIGNAQTIKQFTTEEYEKDKLDVGFKTSILTAWNNMNRVWSNINFYQRITILGTQTLIFIISVYFIRNNTITFGELLAFNAYAGMIFSPFIIIGRNWQTIQNGVVDIQEAEIFLSTPREIYEPKDQVAINQINGNITFDHVNFHYDEGKPILSDISFDVHQGEIIALVGESGVGKSTLIDLISGYHFTTAGHVLIDGHDIKRVNLKLLRSSIAVVPQEVVLFNDTIIKNIMYGNFNATEAEVREAARRAHALDFIHKFPDKWEQVVGERGVKLSVGQKQRIAIARAILRNPKILILDEPTSALDAGSENIITKSLEELMRGKTTFIIAHRLSTVRKANKILVFKEGRIVEHGTHDELIAIPEGEYRRLYELQIGLHN